MAMNIYQKSTVHTYTVLKWILPVKGNVFNNACKRLCCVSIIPYLYAKINSFIKKIKKLKNYLLFLPINKLIISLSIRSKVSDDRRTLLKGSCLFFGV